MSDNSFIPPAELSRAFVAIGEAKAKLPLGKMFLMGIMAGAYIGFASHLASTVGTDVPSFGIKKLIMGAVFACGLMLVMIPGSELFTGNCLMAIPLCARRISFAGMMRNWIVVYAGNLAGSVLLAGIMALSGLWAASGGQVGATAISLAVGKTSAAAVGGLDHNVAFFFRAIGCNILVCLAVMMATASYQVAGKILAIFFPIMAFVTMGFEHSVANMYFIPAGIFAKYFEPAKAAYLQMGNSADVLAGLNWTTMWTRNLLSVTAGNIVGGSIFVGVVYYLIFVRGSGQEKI